MPSNKVLKADIVAIKPDAETAGLSNNQLAEMLKGLKNTAPVEPEVVELPEFTVCAGKSLTTKRGILTEGDEVKPEYLGGGMESLKELFEKGYITHNGE